jgi:hypothetical protein
MAETDVILTPDQRVRVFISSTLEELAAGFSRRADQRATSSALKGGLGLSRRRIAGHRR